MNNQEKDVLKYIFKEISINQRMIAEATGHSLGTVNKCIKELIDNKYLDSEMQLLPKALELIKKSRPQNAIILAAGKSSNFAPFTYEKPKGIFCVKGEILIERQIRQLHEAGVEEIYIVVGYMKEKFFYLEE